jgi:hypothetical protein
MKPTILRISALWLVTTAALFAATPVESARSHLAAAENALPMRARDPGVVIERPTDSLMELPGFKELRAEIPEHWRDHIANLTTVAPTPVAQTIYFKAAQVLSQYDYLQLLVATCERAKAGEIHPMQFRWIVSPYEKHLRKMWEENPPSEELKLAAARVREVIGADSNMGKLMTRIIAGEMAASLRDFHPDANPLSKPASTQAAPSAPEATRASPSVAPAPAVVAAPAPAAPPPAKSLNPLWWIAGAIILAGGAAFVARKKKIGRK